MKKLFLDAAYRKFQLAAGGFIATALLLSVDGKMTLNEWLACVAAAGTAAGVWKVKNVVSAPDDPPAGDDGAPRGH